MLKNLFSKEVILVLVLNKCITLHTVIINNIIWLFCLVVWWINLLLLHHRLLLNYWFLFHRWTSLLSERICAAALEKSILFFSWFHCILRLHCGKMLLGRNAWLRLFFLWPNWRLTRLFSIPIVLWRIPMTINITAIVSIYQRFTYWRFFFFIVWLAWCKPLSFLASWFFFFCLRGLFCWNWGSWLSFSSRSRFDLLRHTITIKVLLFCSWLLHSNRGDSISKCRVIDKYTRCRFYFHEWLDVSLYFLLFTFKVSPCLFAF